MRKHFTNILVITVLFTYLKQHSHNDSTEEIDMYGINGKKKRNWFKIE